MCVLLCANSKVREWIDMPLACAFRETLQVCAAYTCGAIADAPSKDHGKSHASPLEPAVNVERDEAWQRRVMKRSAWLQAYFRYSLHMADRKRVLTDSIDPTTASSCDWPKALKAIAKTWGRFLSLVGLRG